MLEVFQTFAEIATPLETPFFIVGATARDIILTHVYGINTIRATADIDFAIMIDDWQAYETLTKALIDTKKFESTKMRHRFIYKQIIQIDVIPFGAIGGQEAGIFWPPSHVVKMNILGFNEAYQNAISIKVQSHPTREIKLASLAGLAVLKMISWRERGNEDTRDAEDLALILRTYLDAGNAIRIFEEAADLIEDDFDYEQAGAILLGRDIAKILKPDIKRILIEILERETSEQNHYRLVMNMMKNAQVFTDDAFENHLKLLEHLKEGLQET